MKRSLLFIMLLWSVVALSQIPSYYNDVNLTLSGTALKNALSAKIINTHTTDLTYTPNVWNALRLTDLDPNDPTKVVLIYGWDNTDGDITNDRTRDKTLQDTGSGATFVWNREHVYSKSLANPSLVTSSAGAGTDAHNLRPADRTRNTSRSNRKFADGSGTASYITTDGYWYPGDEWKGDVARMMMYMYLRYGNQTLPINVGVGTPVASDNNMILLFLEWNAEDPVSDLEKQRNPILEGLQGNRNPFLDNPAFATQIWGGPQAEDLFGGGGTPDTEAPTVPTNLIVSNTTSSSVSLNWTASTDNISVSSYDIYNGASIVGTSFTTSLTVTGLSSDTSYIFSVRAKDAAGNQSANSTTVNATTNSNSGGTTSDLLFSEYVEGSSNNKALEIANFTGNSVDLSAYDLRKSTNGAGSWSSVYQLSGTLANGDVFVIANSSAVSAITTVANVTTGSGIVTFNGNDAVALFKNGTLIDVIGTFDSSANFAQNTTLRRKSSITNPTTTYSISEWDSYTTDTFDGLGNHTIDGGTQTDTEAPTAPSSLASSNITETSVDLSWGPSTDNVGVTSYDVYNGNSLIGSTASTSYNVTGLTVVTSYSFTVKAKDAVGNESVSSNTANATTVDLTAPSTPSSLTTSNITETSVDLSWSNSSDNVAVTGYEIYNGITVIGSSSTTSYVVTGLTASTSYTFSIRAKDAAGNESSASNSVTMTTNDPLPGGTTSELLFSEYIEGSSNNKALEIANFTGNSVDLSIYTIKKQTNGAGSWSGGLQLTGLLANGDVFVVGHSSAVAAITNVSDITTANSEITFNGNDAVGLFKNNILIDILGTFNSSATYAQNTTLRRKSSVTSPNTTYITSEWDSYATDTFDGLGNHILDGAADTQAPTAPSSLTASNITETTVDLSWATSTDNIGVTGYDVYNGTTFLATTANTNYSVTGLTAGTSYTFTIIAKDAAGNTSLASNVENVTTSSPPPTSIVLSASYFESGWDNWTDGGSDCARYSGSRSWEGNYSIRLRDNSGTASAMTSPVYDITSYSTVEIEFHFYVYSMEIGEDFWFRYFDGSSWQTVQTWIRGSGIENNNFYTATVVLDSATYNFVNNAQFRFQNDASGNADHIYIDQVIITGKNGTSSRGLQATSSLTHLKSLHTNFDSFTIYPNPVEGNTLQIHLQDEETQAATYKVISLLGQVLKTGTISDTTINIGNLKAGVYFLEISVENEKIVQKFVKK